MNRFSAFNINSGSLGERWTWAAFGDPPTSTDIGEVLKQVAVAPDGICLDAEGAVWVADAAHARLLRVAEGGRILEERKTDGIGVFACMLGETTAARSSPPSRLPFIRPRHRRTIAPRS